MKPKPKITKASGEWRVERPGYGFAGPESLGPFPSHAEALRRLQSGTASAGPTIERDITPTAESPYLDWYHGHRIWQPVIR